MKDINKEDFSDFESGWQKAFEDAEISPGKDVWSNIDTNLANKETHKYKRRVAYYKWVAAASVVFAIGLSYFSLNNISTNSLDSDSEKVITSKSQNLIENDAKVNNEPDIAGNDQSIQDEGGLNLAKNNDEAVEDLVNQNNRLKEEVPVSDDASMQQNNERLASEAASLSSDEAYGPSKSSKDNRNSDKDLEERLVAENSEDYDEEVLAVNKFQTREKVADENAQKILVGEPQEENAPLKSDGTVYANASGVTMKPLQSYPYDVEEFYAGLLDPPYIYSIPGVSIMRASKEQEEGISVLWAGLNIGSGLFDPNFQEGSNFQPKTSPALFSSNAVARESSPQEASYKESTDPGISYSLGVNFGVRLTDKWVIQSGIAYAQKRASTNSTTSLQNIKNVSKTPEYLGDLTTASYSNALTNVSQDYQLMNSFEFISVPLKAGYLILDRKIGIMILGGLSADVFLSNTLSESNDKLEDIKVDAGSDSPFRDVVFNGVIGAEFSYEISRNYHLTLEPNYGIALNSLTKSASSFTSNPQTFGIAAGLKFYLK